MLYDCDVDGSLPIIISIQNEQAVEDVLKITQMYSMLYSNLMHVIVCNVNSVTIKLE